jgi:hypothetical protein
MISCQSEIMSLKLKRIETAIYALDGSPAEEKTRRCCIRRDEHRLGEMETRWIQAPR